MKTHNIDYSRRSFVKESLLLGGSLFLIPSAFAQSTINTIPGRLSRQIMVDQAIIHALASPQANDQLKKLLTADLHQHLPGNVARIGWTFPMQKERIIELLEAVKADYASNSPSEFAQEKAALAIGVMAAWPVMLLKPAVNEKASLYQDVALLKYLNGLPPEATVKGRAEDLALLFKEMIPRTHTRMHTNIPDDDDPHGWILRVDQWRRETDQYFDQLALAYLNPDKQLVKKYVMDTNFYQVNSENCESMSAMKAGEKLVLQVKKYLDDELSISEIEDFF